MVGTYTTGTSEGIYIFDFNPLTGQMIPMSVCQVQNPSYLVANRRGDYVYAVTENETGDSYVNALCFDTSKGLLTPINRVLTGGEAACHIAMDPQEKFVVTANYAGGNISIFRIVPGGGLSEYTQNISFTGQSVDAERQEAPHPHCSIFSRDGKFLFVTDLGTDTIHRFTVDYFADGKFLVEGTRKDFLLRPGSGPRHLVFDKTGEYLYLVNELGGTIVSFQYNQGELKQFQENPIDHISEEGGGGIVLSPDGQFLFVSMREGNDGIALFKVGKDGKLDPQNYFGVSEHPRDLSLSPDGNYLLVTAMKDNRVEILEVHRNGFVEDTGKFVTLDKPAFVSFIG